MHKRLGFLIGTLGAIALTLGFPAFLVLEKLYDERWEASFREKMLAVRGVKAIAKFLDYEGSRSATIVLEDGKLLSISRFDFSIFHEGRSIYLNHIDGLGIGCRSGFDFVSSPVAVPPLNSLLTSPPAVSVRKVDDLVARHGEISKRLREILPIGEHEATRILVDPMTNVNGDVWCYLYPVKGEA